MRNQVKHLVSKNAHNFPPYHKREASEEIRQPFAFLWPKWRLSLSALRALAHHVRFCTLGGSRAHLPCHTSIWVHKINKRPALAGLF